jgi:hypothetical protein
MGDMPATVPLSKLQRSPGEVTELVAREDVILDRRDADDLYLSTRERHDREVQAQLLTTEMLANLARDRPDIAGEIVMQSLPWIGWMPSEDRVACLQELLDDLRAGAQTGDLRRFTLDLAAWQSTAVAYNDPEVLAALRRDSAVQGAELIAVEHPADMDLDDDLEDLDDDQDASEHVAIAFTNRDTRVG